MTSLEMDLELGTTVEEFRLGKGPSCPYPFYETIEPVRQYSDKSKPQDLVDYELRLPTKYSDGIALKRFCLSQEKDFDRFHMNRYKDN